MVREHDFSLKFIEMCFTKWYMVNFYEYYMCDWEECIHSIWYRILYIIESNLVLICPRFLHVLWLFVLFSYSFFCDSLRPHGLQHTRLPCSSPSARICSNSCPSSRWRHPTISSSVSPFSSCLQSFPASGSFAVSQLFIPGGWYIGASASASVLPINILGWFPCCPRDSQEPSPAPQVKNINSSVFSLLYGSALTSICNWKTMALAIRMLVSKGMSLLFNMLSGFVIAFLYAY